MFGGRHIEANRKANASSSPRRRGLRPSRGFLLAMAGVVLVALLLAGVAGLAALTPGEGARQESIQPDSATPIPLEITVIPPEVTPEPDFARSVPGPATSPANPEPMLPGAVCGAGR